MYRRHICQTVRNTQRARSPALRAAHEEGGGAVLIVAGDAADTAEAVTLVEGSGAVIGFFHHEPYCAGAAGPEAAQQGSEQGVGGALAAKGGRHRDRLDAAGSLDDASDAVAHN